MESHIFTAFLCLVLHWTYIISSVLIEPFSRYERKHIKTKGRDKNAIQDESLCIQSTMNMLLMGLLNNLVLQLNKLDNLVSEKFRNKHSKYSTVQQTEIFSMSINCSIKIFLCSTSHTLMTSL